VSELIQQCLPAIGKRPAEPNIEELRDTLLSQHLAAIVHYTEGYVLPYEGDGHVPTRFVARCLYGNPLSTQGFRLPQK